MEHNLRQTGLSIKNSWQQFMSEWVQPELEINERLFAMNNGSSGLWALEKMPFQNYMEELHAFSEKLCFAQWLFEPEDTVPQRQPFNGPEAISGRRPTFLPQAKRVIVPPVAHVSTKDPINQEPTREFSMPAEGLIDAIESEGKPGDWPITGRTPALDFNPENEEAGSGIRKNKNNLSPQTGSAMPELTNLERFSAADFAVPDQNFVTGQKEQNDAADAGMLPGKILQNRVSQDGSKMKAVFRNPEEGSSDTRNQSTDSVTDEPVPVYPELSAFNSNHGIRSFYRQPLADDEIAPGEQGILPPVKTLKSLGSWLQQNAMEELSGIENMEKMPTAAFSGFKTRISGEDDYPNLFEINTENNHSFEFPPFNGHSIAHQNTMKPVSDIFEDPFQISGEKLNMPDSEDIIRELTEQLNREFKRFYGA